MNDKPYQYNLTSALRKRCNKNVTKRMRLIAEERRLLGGQGDIQEMNAACTQAMPTETTAPDLHVTEQANVTATVEHNVECSGNDFCSTESSRNNTYQFFQQDFVTWSPDCSDSDSSEICDNQIKDKLADWAVNFGISLAALSALLKILKPSHPILPTDGRSLLKTKRHINIVQKAGGSFYHFGVLPAISNLLAKIEDHLSDGQTLFLQLNIDGLPLFKSDSKQFWPILGMLKGVSCKEVVLISLFCGSEKPSSLQTYLEDVVQDIRELKAGFNFRGKKMFIEVSSIMCDAPARAFVKGIKSHTGYYGCDKCSQAGNYIDRRMTFPESYAPRRTNESFRKRHCEDHHNNNSPFEDIPSLQMVTQFPMDYMHLVCLGVMRRMLKFWIGGPLSCRLSAIKVTELSSLLISFQPYIPSEFARKPRALRELDRWKATEFRQFLLYTGPVVLQHILKKPVYENFMLLFTSIYILASPMLCAKYSDYTQKLLGMFIEHFGRLYGNQFLTYNVHGLIHLPEDVTIHGNLDKISGFPFENFLGKLKKLIRKPEYPVSQVVCRILEKNNRTKVTPESFTVLNNTLKKTHFDGPIPPGARSEGQFKEAHLEHFCVKLSVGDNCVGVDDKIVIVHNILQNKSEGDVVYEEFTSRNAFFSYPLKSPNIGIYLVGKPSGNLKVASLTKVIHKYVLLPFKGGAAGDYVAVPMLHHT